MPENAEVMSFFTMKNANLFMIFDSATGGQVLIDVRPAKSGRDLAIRRDFGMLIQPMAGRVDTDFDGRKNAPCFVKTTQGRQKNRH
jgi:hypothetical protein